MNDTTTPGFRNDHSANCTARVTKVGRPTINGHVMTPAERMRRHRARKRNPSSIPPTKQTRAQFAKSIGISPRFWYIAAQYNRCRAFEWSDDILAGKHGRCGLSFVADVCKHAQPGAQREIHDAIIEHGAAFGRKLWRMAKAATITEREGSP